ncbi:hypothetical protein [Modestobacter sp. VKM Ac-2978]|uniref:hypothetical protein n=1 Tax=Modestobacter sp. VKM Ac-2978 TaxID=3004132 RepID=UPI0022AAE444|nr:hypothetical protein [Modestobacter sp. VKM Ac-2978]MCZ2850010.1 hypothetical protein [Modestobacter sp. VKM Ac-2978]
MPNRQPWPTRNDSSRDRLADGYDTAPNSTGRHPTPRAGDQQKADALLAAADRGAQLSPRLRLQLGFAELDRTRTDKQED